MHSYEAVHGRLPPAVVYGKDGRPLLSWRVLLLPHLELQDLYEQFHLDETWDGPHNLPLLKQMPATFAAPGRKSSRLPAYHTVCHVFVGHGTAFEDPHGLPMADFPDGLSNTLLIVEAGPPVPWTKPEELPYAPDRPLPALDCLFRDGFRFAHADGLVSFFKKEGSEALLRALITRNGGKKIPLSDSAIEP